LTGYSPFWWTPIQRSGLFQTTGAGAQGRGGVGGSVRVLVPASDMVREPSKLVSS